PPTAWWPCRSKTRAGPAVIRALLNVQPYDSAARTLIAAVVREAALTKEDLRGTPPRRTSMRPTALINAYNRLVAHRDAPVRHAARGPLDPGSSDLTLDPPAQARDLQPQDEGFANAMPILSRIVAIPLVGELSCRAPDAHGASACVGSNITHNRQERENCRTL